MFLPRVVVVGIALMLASCENYHEKPICNDGNRVAISDVPHAIGDYVQASQDPDTFQVSTLTFSVAQGDVRLATTGPEGDLCRVGGAYYMEARNEMTGHYQLQRLFVSETGMMFLSVFYDPKDLAAAAVPYEIFVMPEPTEELWRRVPAGLKRWLEDEEDPVRKGLLIKNADVPAETFLRSAHVASHGEVWVRVTQ